MSATSQSPSCLNYMRTPFANEGVLFAILGALELSERLNTLPFLCREVGADALDTRTRANARTGMHCCAQA